MNEKLSNLKKVQKRKSLFLILIKDQNGLVNKKKK